MRQPEVDRITPDILEQVVDVSGEEVVEDDEDQDRDEGERDEEAVLSKISLETGRPGGFRLCLLYTSDAADE